MQLSIFNSLLPQVFTSQLNVLFIQASQQEVAGGLKWTRTIDGLV